MTFARTNMYAAAYTKKVTSRDPELVALVEWTVHQPGSGLLLVGPRADSIDFTKVGADLVRKGAKYESSKQYNSSGWGSDRVIALWPDRNTIASIEDQGGLEAFGVLTWAVDESAEWAAGARALDVLTGETATAPVIDDPIVLGAYRVITNSANLSSGLTDPSDWDTAVTSLRYLYENGHVMQADEVAAWALSVGWDYRHAREFGRLATDIADGKRKQLKSKGGRAPDREILEKVGRDKNWVAC